MKQKYPIAYAFILIFIFVPSIFIAEGLVLLLVDHFFEGTILDEAGKQGVISISLSVLVSLPLVYLYRKYVDKADFMSIGFQTRRRLLDLILGIGLGAFLIALGFLILQIFGLLEVVSLNFDFVEIASLLFILIGVSFHEEIVTRGFLLNGLMDVSNKYLALVISSLIFSLFHFFNPNFNLIAFINIFLAGIFLGVSYIHSRNLWFPIGLHFSWNFFQGPIFGFEVSGNKTFAIIEQSLNGNELLTGGEFGFEGSIIATILILISIVLIDIFFRKSEEVNKVLKVDYQDKDLFVKN